MKTIFVVEDDPNLLEAIHDALTEHAFEVVCCNKSTVFWKKMKKHKPDAVVLDVFLEDGRGDEITQKLKKHEEYAAIPVILMSATQELRERADASQADAYLSKPFSLDQFTQVLQMYVK